MPDADSAFARTAELLAEAAAASLDARGSFSLALSGGGSIKPMLEQLDPEALVDEGVSIFQVDERVAPDGDPERNLTQILAALPTAAVERLRPMPVLDPDPDAAVARYEEELPDALDLVHLGLGPDGHTASLVPGDPVLEVRDRRVALTAGSYQGRRRMTLTYAALEAARRIVWLVTGADKRDALARLLDGDPSIPAGRVTARDAAVICDPAAAG
ncbi:MAG TPA: 6-phosphogluconolactonase [Solirubrobacterales bacterium]|nr:6-phosphogluconolactonase [Solirubrobacterales bacterium]